MFVVARLWKKESNIIEELDTQLNHPKNCKKFPLSFFFPLEDYPEAESSGYEHNLCSQASLLASS